MSRALARLAREPLLHFAVLGALLFALFALVGREPGGSPQRIVVTRETQAHLAARFERSWQRPPTPAELEGLVAEHVREEILVREARALGFDRDDVVVRRRLRQKLELLAEAAGRSAEPGEEELAAFFAERREHHRIEPRFSFRQLGLSRDRRGAALARDAEQLLARLQAEEAAEPDARGDPLPLPAALEEASASEVERLFGAPFAARLAELPLGAWSGPVESPFGLHLVRIEARSPGRDPALAEVREAVLRDWRAAQAEAAVEALYQELRAGYEVVVEPPPRAPGAAHAELVP